MGYGRVELCGRAGAEQLPVFQRLCGVPALSPWCGPALPHLGGLQYQAAIAAAGASSNQDLQAVGANLAKHPWLGSLDGVSQGIKKDLLPHRSFLVIERPLPQAFVRGSRPRNALRTVTYL